MSCAETGSWGEHICDYISRNILGTKGIPCFPPEETEVLPEPKPCSTARNYVAALDSPNVQIKRNRIFNRPETRVFYAAKKALRDLRLEDWHIHGQVSYGRIFQTLPTEGYAEALGYNPQQAINSKSADVVIADNLGQPVLVIEYQGSGHDPRNDELKLLVCCKAGVCFLDVYPEDVANDNPYRDTVDIDKVKQSIIERLVTLGDAVSGTSAEMRNMMLTAARW